MYSRDYGELLSSTNIQSILWFMLTYFYSFQKLKVIFSNQRYVRPLKTNFRKNKILLIINSNITYYQSLIFYQATVSQV